MPDEGSKQQLLILAKTWLDLATEFEISGALLNSCSMLSERRLEEELERAVELRADLMRQIDGQQSAFDA